MRYYEKYLPIPELFEGPDHREVSLHGKRYCHVHTGSQAGLGKDYIRSVRCR